MKGDQCGALNQMIVGVIAHKNVDSEFVQIFGCKDFFQTFSKTIISFSRLKVSMGNSMVLRDI